MRFRKPKEPAVNVGLLQRTVAGLVEQAGLHWSERFPGLDSTVNGLFRRLGDLEAEVSSLRARADRQQARLLEATAVADDVGELREIMGDLNGRMDWLEDTMYAHATVTVGMDKDSEAYRMLTVLNELLAEDLALLRTRLDALDGGGSCTDCGCEECWEDVPGEEGACCGEREQG